ncbi:MAG: hypothetical protein RR011_04020, partial [Oscillospiraceae bacterium]
PRNYNPNGFLRLYNNVGVEGKNGCNTNGGGVKLPPFLGSTINVGVSRIEPIKAKKERIKRAMVHQMFVQLLFVGS